MQTFYRPKVVTGTGRGHGTPLGLIALAVAGVAAIGASPLVMHAFWLAAEIAAGGLGVAIIGSLGYLAHVLAHPEMKVSTRHEIDAAVAAMYAPVKGRQEAARLPAPPRFTITLTPARQGPVRAPELHGEPSTVPGQARPALRMIEGGEGR
jgi:hypothetical protein